MPVNLVEAAGIEPASENARSRKSYVRFRFDCFARHLRIGKRVSGLVRLCFGSQLRTEAFDTYPVK